MGGSRGKFGKAFRSDTWMKAFQKRGIYDPYDPRIQAFRKAHPDAPPPAKGKKYDQYIAEYNKAHPTNKEVTDVAATPTAAATPVASGPLPEANLTGPVAITPAPTQQTANLPGSTAKFGASQGVEAPSMGAAASPQPQQAAPAQPALPMQAAQAGAGADQSNLAAGAAKANQLALNQAQAQPQQYLPNLAGLRFGGS